MTPATPISISLSRFTQSVQAAVTAAVKQHPKFSSIGVPDAVTISFLIRGIPVPEAILSKATIAEGQAFANEVAGNIAGAFPQAFAVPGRGGSTEGAILSIGRHVVIGIPPVAQTLRLER
jgi:hypothetical protein